MNNLNWIGITQQTLLITSFVIIMMLLIEFVNVYSKGKITNRLKKRPVSQIFLGIILGLLPGCMGAFTVVSLYTHRVISFGALLAAMIATSGDEAFFMFILIPDKVLLIFSVLTITALITGLLTDKLFSKYDFVASNNFKFEIHETNCASDENKIFSLKNFSLNYKRFLIIAGLVLVVLGSSVGVIMHTHNDYMLFKLPQNLEQKYHEVESVHSCNHENHEHHEHQHNHNSIEPEHNHGAIDWVTVSVIIVAVLSIIIMLFSSEHFVNIHIWQHLIKKHLPKIVLWTFGIMIIINLLLNYTDFGEWIYNNMYLVLIIAVLIGIIPESGPHLLFLVLFVYGQIPISILIANSIVQDGHGSLPLLAESKKSFVIMKIISILVALIIGFGGLLIENNF